MTTVTSVPGPFRAPVTSKDSWRTLFVDLSSNLSSEEFVRITQYLRRRQIPLPGEENLKSSLDIFIYLENIGCISGSDISLLMDILDHIERKSLKKMVAAHQENTVDKHDDQPRHTGMVSKLLITTGVIVYLAASAWFVGIESFIFFGVLILLLGVVPAIRGLGGKVVISAIIAGAAALVFDLSGTVMIIIFIVLSIGSLIQEKLKQRRAANFKATPSDVL
ncbi:uncharacterized protein LOC102805572 [Saccoglossus kowalevskii]|uniref:Uncharacterized protein LOC102805572 n=1 Tax=Saccoglossus kowalevskii TaxID=10224 RepID=A0ABM0M5V2_SACKO|nr:PREDICTED: uncharacterized protein LOC102805572 [Saccoglossus kowalevskii]